MNLKQVSKWHSIIRRPLWDKGKYIPSKSIHIDELTEQDLLADDWEGEETRSISGSNIDHAMAFLHGHSMPEEEALKMIHLVKKRLGFNV